MIWLNIIFIISVIFLCGVVFESIMSTSCSEPLRHANGFNPAWWHRNYHVNHFGAMMRALVFTIFYPIAVICYLIYKLCTVGRR
jgi:hypothetical protein